METFYLRNPDEDMTAFDFRMALKEAFPDVKLELIQALNAHILTGCLYPPKIQKRIEKLKNALADIKLKELDISEMKTDSEYITAIAAAIINPEVLVSEESLKPPAEVSTEAEESEAEESEEEESEGDEPEKVKPKRKLAKKPLPEVKTEARQITLIAGSRINYYEVEDIAALQTEIAKANRMTNFKLHLINYLFGEKLRTYKGLEAQKVKQEAQQWFAGRFYANLAVKNIVDFEVQSFQNDKIPEDKVTEFWADSNQPPKLGNYVLQPIGEDLSLEFANKKILLSKSFYDLSAARYIGDQAALNTAIFIIGLRYSVLEIDTQNYLAVPSVVRRKFKFELFGSPFNSDLSYFSPFPEVEAVFGSEGNFFTTIPEDEYTRAIFFPPEEEDVINLAIDVLLEEDLQTERTVLCVLPVWDPIQRKSLGLNLMTENNKPTSSIEKAKRFSGYDRIKASKFFVEEMVDNELLFFNFANAEKVNKGPICLIILASGKPRFKLAGLMELWREFNTKS
jgi:hypothetical protein